MANSREYAHFIKGSKLAIVERDRNDTSGLTSPSSVPSVELPNQFTKWKSPQASISNGIEIEYAYSPKYRINDIEDKSTAITGYDESSGLLKFTGSGLSTDAAITYIVIEGSAKWNGLHKINTLNSSYWLVDTKYNGAVVTESGITAYTDISALVDESSEIDVPSYLSKALVYYVKSKMAEDIMELEITV